ncbi:hypothetical protein CWI42_020530 [Ordospora colligata]|uniref:Uncharacterized protein n=1 Tax=Ordospora colligata OC4 TaxID=1354746 RepID=A0A0B2ULL2_9MICR|nr:uncharacterized protein M896_020540 [Ordospora colligata OC4]KHN70218.1 hypothetical protein M896_020540 [Ordospora colligata OC4]TBU16762.1 hypothetical protein CWI41_020550 [Ordospora colligata]TBU17068.1 hypothetical protein CWI40_020550 [Ordospora colligata]TBU19311.1 hypothetical protein CWI42_020530 [Ordospora colligata]
MIRELIVCVLEGRDIDVKDLPMDMADVDESLNDMEIDDILECVISYIHGVSSDRAGRKEDALRLFNEYCADCEYLKLVCKETIEMCRKKEREGRIRIQNKMREFRFEVIDWEDREWVMKLIEYFYVMGMKNVEHLNAEIELLEKSDECRASNQSGIECVRIDESGRAENMLVRRNKPTMSLDEFADKLMASMKNEVKVIDDTEPEEKYTRNELIMKDNERDWRGSNRGNTIGMG